MTCQQKDLPLYCKNRHTHSWSQRFPLKVIYKMTASFLSHFPLENLAFTNLIFCLPDFQTSPGSLQCQIDSVTEFEMKLVSSWYPYFTILSQSLYYKSLELIIYSFNFKNHLTQKKYWNKICPPCFSRSYRSPPLAVWACRKDVQTRREWQAILPNSTHLLCPLSSCFALNHWGAPVPVAVDTCEDCQTATTLSPVAPV